MPAVLIVDDDPFIRKLVATTLEDVAGFELLEAADGGEALDVAAGSSPQLVFLDIDMPNLNGYEVCRRVGPRAGGAPGGTRVCTRGPGGGAGGARPGGGAGPSLAKRVRPPRG